MGPQPVPERRRAWAPGWVKAVGIIGCLGQDVLLPFLFASLSTLSLYENYPGQSAKQCTTNIKGKASLLIPVMGTSFGCGRLKVAHAWPRSLALRCQHGHWAPGCLSLVLRLGLRWVEAGGGGPLL